MKVVTTFHQPSSVLASVKCQLSSRDQEHLVVAKLNRLDVYLLQPECLKHKTGIDVRGKVLTVKSIPIAGSSRSNLLLMLAHPDPELVLLTYKESEDGIAELNAKKQVSLYERIPRPAEFFNDVLVHPGGKLAIASCYTGKLKVVTLKAGNYENDFDISVPELNILSLAFLPLPEDQYALAILHLDYQERVQLLARDVIVEDYELSSVPSTLLQQTSISNKFIPLPTDLLPKLVPVPYNDYEEDIDEDEVSFLGGILVLGGKRLLLYELSSEQSQEKQKGKRRRLENRKQSQDTEEVIKAKQKEKEREARKRKPTAGVDWPWGEVTGICVIDASRFIIGDGFGKLAMLSVDDPKNQGLILVPLGETSAPTTISYLTNQVIFVGSHLGDSHLVQISSTPTSSQGLPTLEMPPEIKTTSLDSLSQPRTSKGKGRALENDEDNIVAKGTILETKGSYVTILDTFKNIAPILDATLVDPEGSGQKQIVTCSGGANTGSISVVRNGANFQEIAVIPGLTNVTQLRSLKEQYGDTTDSYIIASTLEATHIFQINDAGKDTTLSHLKDTDFETDKPTLAISNIARRQKENGKPTYSDSHLVVQVTRGSVRLLEFDIGTGAHVRLNDWALDGAEVVAADITSSQVVLALRGGMVQVLTITPSNIFEFIGGYRHSSGREISSLSCAPLDRSAYFTKLITISYWDTRTIHVLQLHPHGPEPLCESQPMPSLVRSAILFNFGTSATPKAGPEYYPHLVAGLANGSVVYMAWKDQQLKESKVVSLGSTPVSLTTCEIDGHPSVLAVGSRALALSWERKRLHSSPIIFKDIQAAAKIHTKSFSSSFILATSTGLTIGSILDLGKMHIRTVPLGLDNPRKIVHEPTLKAFGVIMTHTQPARVGEFEEIRSSFKLFDDTTFSVLAQYNGAANEQFSALALYPARIRGAKTPLLCIGSFDYDSTETEPSMSRIVLLSAISQSSPFGSPATQLSKVTVQETAGCIYDLAIANDMIVAAVSSSVVVYRPKTSGNLDNDIVELEKLAEWNHNYMITSLSTYNDSIVVGDQISSVSLLKITEGGRLESVARDYGPLWPVAVSATAEESLIGANDSLNLFSFKMTRNLGRSLLERDGYYQIADLVTKFIKGSLTSEFSKAFEPQHVYFTSSGRIGVIAGVRDEALSVHLTELQRNLASGDTCKGVGLSHPRSRAPVNSRGRSDADQAASGFLDGDFLEQFLGHLGSTEIVEKVMEGTSEPEQLTMAIEDIQKVLESLQSIH